MNEEQSKKSIYKKWWFWVGGVVVLFILIGAFGVEHENDVQQSNETQQENESTVEVPQYSVLDKTEHISTRMSDTQASYFGDVLIEEDVIDIPPEEFIKIARVIAEREGLDRSATFYLTEDAYKANVTLYVSDEYRDIHEQTGMELENNEEYRTPEEIAAFMHEGYIGNLEDNEFRMSPSSAYYEQHRGSSNEENDWIVK